MKAEGRSRTKQRLRAGICVIGAGNWGSSLAAGVAGSEISLVEVVGRKASSRRFGKLTVTSFRKAAFDAEVLWICVPDGEIAEAAAAIAARRGGLRGQVVLHSSGALTITVLESVKRAGALVGGVAPVFSFATREPVALAGLLFAVESAVGLSRKLAAIVRKLGGRPFGISAEKKVLYHAAATMASPLLVSALDGAVRTAGLAGLSAEDAKAVVEVLAEVTLRNYFEKGSERSFSGAFARGDVGTVELHLRELLAHPTLSDVYRALAANAVESLPVRNALEFRRILGDSMVGKERVRN
jgi:predicted short-subunit dehydrogenase-like oxidoreductase (DUF2520 family)